MRICCVRGTLRDGMDDIDRRIVALLRENARRSFKDIGSHVGLTAPAVKRRVDRLERDGVIRGYTAMVDPRAFGWHAEAFVDLYCEGRMPADRTVRFHDIDRWPYDEWALEARRGRWEPRTLARFAELVRPGDTVLDVGAHFGIYTLLASELVGPSGRVVAFEPDPVSRSQLEKN